MTQEQQQKVELACKVAAGFIMPGGHWPVNSRQQDVVKAVRIKVNHGEILTIGWQQAMRSICMGVAELLGPEVTQ